MKKQWFTETVDLIVSCSTTLGGAMDISEARTREKPIGFWGVWSLTAGCMIGSGIFLLPTVLAPFGLIGLAGWLVTGVGAISLALVFGRLAARTRRTGGPAVFVGDAFGAFAGFIAGWSLWISYAIAIPTIAIAFVGYAGSLFPIIKTHTGFEIALALSLIWGLTMISIKGTQEASRAAIVMTVLKLVPLLIVIVLPFFVSERYDLPRSYVNGDGIVGPLAAAALLTMWAFLGLEAGTVAMDDVRGPRNMVPRAVAMGVVTVTVIYVAVTVATMVLVPAAQLATSEAPLLDATRALGRPGFLMVAIGALVSTAGALHVTIFVSGHIASGMAKDGLVPTVMARCNKGGAPAIALITCSALASVLLVANYFRGLIGAFTFLLMMSTATALLPYLMSALAELKQSWSSSRGWVALAFVAACYGVFAIIGSGLIVLFWGGLLVLVGIPIYVVAQRRRSGALIETGRAQ